MVWQGPSKEDLGWDLIKVCIVNRRLRIGINCYKKYSVYIKKDRE